MVVEDVGNEVMRFAVRVAGLALAVPMVAGFVTLGAAVLVGRSVRALFWRRETRREPQVEQAKAA
jgi:hypothetical protein